ncbi:TonB-dependent receptor domain-containing protein [Novosphingobium piscinae]|uniref:TonB-dependent receptor n=2 Tax=Novosphingobium piscinae TaxID=1507448 RepID=A0A7X1FXF1_9SPHN|nr:TonB-dependent receptor [Novosphingobium piscinae]MBC2668798.1 TonB-dependent receptor [Novosphingobium piscinae]
MKLRNTVGRAALAIGLTIAAQPAMAQSSPAAGGADASDTGEIIVTAQKRAENVQQVPLAVSVLSPSQLQAAGVRQFQDLTKLSPSLTIRPAEHPVNANVSLRGVGTFAFGIGVEPSVAVLVDEVPLAFQARAFTDLPDVERIEVLRGPQSTLYGKSASAGLINIITRGPTDTFNIRVNGTGTTDGEVGANFSASGPLGETLGYVLSGSYSKWDGNVRNLFNNQKVNGNQTFNTRAKLRWEPSDTASLTLTANYLKGDTTVGRPFVRMGANALLRGTAGLTPAVTLPGVVINEDNQTISNNFPASTSYSGWGGNLRGEFELGNHSLVSITSYDKFRLDDFLDQDDTSSTAAVGANIQVGAFKSKLFTQEFRLLSPGDQPFRYTLGAYYASVRFDRPFLRGPAFSLADWTAYSKSDQIAGFVQADWEFMPNATLTGGARLQNEKIRYAFTSRAAPVGTWSGNASDTAATWRASLKYEFSPTVNVFGTVSTGYKGQTYDLTTGFNNNRAAAGPIKPEKSRDIEVGIRSQLFDRKVTLNVTLFDTAYRNLQAQTIETLADGTANFRLTNVGKLSTKGVEIDTLVRPNDTFSINGSFAILDATYTDFPVAPCFPLQTAAQGCTTVAGQPSRQNLTGERAVQAPEFKFSIGAEFTPSLTDTLRGVVQANWQHTSSVFYVARDPETFQPAYSIVNLGLGVRDEDRKWEVTAFVNNLFDQEYFPSLANSAGNWGNNQATQVLLPRDFRRYGGIRFNLNY